MLRTVIAGRGALVLAEQADDADLARVAQPCGNLPHRQVGTGQQRFGLGQLASGDVILDIFVPVLFEYVGDVLRRHAERFRKNSKVGKLRFRAVVDVRRDALHQLFRFALGAVFMGSGKPGDMLGQAAAGVVDAGAVHHLLHKLFVKVRAAALRQRVTVGKALQRGGKLVQQAARGSRAHTFCFKVCGKDAAQHLLRLGRVSGAHILQKLLFGLQRIIIVRMGNVQSREQHGLRAASGLQAAVLQRLSGLVVAKGKLLQPLLHGRNAYKDIKLKLLCAEARQGVPLAGCRRQCGGIILS